MAKMQAVWNGAVVAESDDTVMVEGNHYFPRSSLWDDCFRESPTQTVCSWKGRACYYHIMVEGEENRDAAWYYPDPKPAAAAIKDRVAFWHGVTVQAAG